jgi:hypothetical protein
MGNTLGTLAGALVLQEVLSTLLVEFPVITDICTDLSNASAKLNQTIDARVVVAGTAIAFNQNNGYVEADRTTVDVPVTMSSHVHHTFAVTDVEQSSTNRKLRDELVKTAVHAVGTKIVTDLFAIVLAASYPQSYEVSAGNFDRDDIVKIRTKLQKLKVPTIGRFAVLNSDYAEGLLLDSTLMANPNGSNAGATASGNVPRNVHNFMCSEFTDLPTNNEKLAGIAGNRESIVMAARVPEIPADPSEIPGRIQNVTEPNTGLTVQHRRYYSMQYGKLVESFTLMYGFAAGLSRTAACDRLVRIVTP